MPAMSADTTSWHPSLGAKVLIQVLCIGAIKLCSERQLARWLAFNEAAPPTTVSKTTPEPTVAKTWKEQWSGRLSAFLIFATFLLPMAGLLGPFNEGGIMQLCLVDGPWGLFMLHMWTTSFATALYGIFPPARTIRKLRQNNDDKTWAFEQVTDGPTSGFRWSNPKVNKVAGFLCATLLFISAYFDGKELFPLAWAAQVVWALVGWHAPRIRMKAIVMIQLGVVLLFVVIGGLAYLFGQDNRSIPPETQSSSDGHPSPWLLRITSIVSSLMVFCVPGIFIQFNMRYEHTRVAPTSIRIPSAPGEPVSINHKAPQPKLPLYEFTIAALIASCSLADSLSFFGASRNFSVDQMIIINTAIPLLVGGTAVYTFFRGDLKDWWNYTEIYRQDIDLETVTEVDEHGREIPVDEKRPVTP